MRAHKERIRVVELCIALSRKGYFAGTGGNLALRIDAEHIAVTPSATDYFAMTAADVCVMRLTDLTCIDGDKKPSVETGLHARLLRKRADVLCSIHTHQPIASACALLGKPLAVDTPSSRRILGALIPIVGYLPSGTGLLAAKVGRAIRSDINAYLMRNHGVLCCGDSIDAAMTAVEELEHLAKKYLCAQIANRIDVKPALANSLRHVLSALEHS